jgi:hypothetical protein
MKILKMENREDKDGVIIEALIGNGEFRQLAGYLDWLVSFSANTISEPARAIKTGARHSYARYLLLPIKIRKRFKVDTHDFENIKCGAVEYRDMLFVIYGVPNKFAANSDSEG